MLSTDETIAYDKALTQPLWPFNSYVKSSLSSHTFDPYNALPVQVSAIRQQETGLEILWGRYDLLCGIVRAGLCQPKLLGALQEMATADAECCR